MDMPSSVPQIPMGPQHLPLRSGQTRNPQEIAQAATGFEELFLSMLLKEMRETLEPGVMMGEDQSDVFGGLFDLFMSQHLATAGALGIADMVKNQVTAGKQG